MAGKFYEGIGRRKEASARVRIMNGSGAITVNGKDAKEYFGRDGDIKLMLKPMSATDQAVEQYDISVLVQGGGPSGQRDAIVLGLARALLEINPEYRPALRKAGVLTRDSRIKERKKPGLKRARKAPTYTKR